MTNSGPAPLRQGSSRARAFSSAPRWLWLMTIGGGRNERRIRTRGTAPEIHALLLAMREKVRGVEAWQMVFQPLQAAGGEREKKAKGTRKMNDASAMIVLSNAQTNQVGAFSTPISDQALALCGMLALTSKGVSEGWEPLKQWNGYQLLDCIRRTGRQITDSDWRNVLGEVQSVPVFALTISYYNGMLHFNPPTGRDIAVLMMAFCQNAGVFSRYTLNEAYENAGLRTVPAAEGE